MNSLNERKIIDIIKSRVDKNKQREDDVSILSLPVKRTRSIILKCDMLVESTDVPPVMSLSQIARKSVCACVSDLSAKGIKPSVSLISVGIPKKYSRTEIEDLAKGFQIASREFAVTIIGGDTNESKELIIDCNMIGFSEKDAAKLPGRDGASPGDLVVVSGEFGYAPSGLKILCDNSGAYGEFMNRAILSVLQPKPAQKFGLSLAKFFSASTDSSDGLSISLYELARQSNVNFLIDDIPSAKGVCHFARNNHLDYKDLVFNGGEEYEIVATIAKADLKIAMSTARRLKLKLLIIGKVEKGDGKVYLLDSKRGRYYLLKRKGYIHFKNLKGGDKTH